MKADPRHIWMGRYPMDMTRKQFANFRCSDLGKPGLARVMPKYVGLPDVLIYKRCIHTLYCSMRRMMIQMPQPDVDRARDFRLFYEREVEMLVNDYGHNIKYDFGVWYNHLTRFQQARVDKVNPDLDLFETLITIMTKVELQVIEKNDDWPKPRAISMPTEGHKYGTGPLAFALEYFCKKYLEGFASGLSFQDKEQFLNLAESRGYTMRIADDCKGWDLGVKLENDAFMFFIIKLIDNMCVSGVDSSCVKKQLTERWHRVKAELRDGDGFIKLGYMWILDQMFSGTTVTLLRNTFNNIMLKRYIAKRLLNLHSFMLACSGDDSEMYIYPMSKDVVRTAFLKVGTLDVNKHGGLGIVFKYLDITGLDAYNFCQTEAFKCQICGWKIIRIMKNVLIKMMYSQKFLSMSCEQREVYLTSLYDSGMLWADRLPIFVQHYAHFNFQTRNYSTLKVGHRKKKIPVTEETQYLQIHDPPIFEMLFNIDRDYYYANRGRISEKNYCCVQAFIEMLYERYGLCDSTLRQICYEIENPVDGEINSVLLADALRFRDSYVFDC